MKGERWCKEAIKAVRGTPAQPNPEMPGFRIPVRVRMPENQTPQEATRTRASEKLPRKMYIQKSDMEKYGYTENCKGCRAQQAGLKPNAHSEGCRQIIEREVRVDSPQAVRVEQFDHRQSVGFEEWQKSAEHAEQVIRKEKQDDRKDNDVMNDEKKEPEIKKDEPVGEPKKREFGESVMPSSSGGDMVFSPAKAQKK